MIPIYVETILWVNDYYVQIGYITGKYDNHGRHSGRDCFIKVSTNNKRGSLEVEIEDYDKIEIGDTILLDVSSRGGIYIHKLFPTHEKIERYKVPQHYVNGKLQEKPSYEQYSAAVRDSVLRHSHKQVGYVYEKTDDEYYRHLVKVGIDAEHTTTHEFYETDRNYTKVYKRLHVGDAVILQVADSLPEINRVLCWQPDGNDIANYATYEAIKDYSNCSKEFETEKLLNLHNRKAIVYDKYEDEHVGAYLEVGIDEKHVRTYMFKTYSKEFKQIYQVVNVGDMVIAQVSDEIPQLNRVVNWQTTIDGEKDNHLQDEYTYVTIANVKSKKTREEYLGRSYRKGTFYYVKLKIGNKMETNYVKIKSTRHRQIFESLHEGDSVLVKMTEGKTKTVSVLDWQPTREEIEKYKRSVRLIE
ncbi:MAG: hypothetical protein K6G73_03700 [Marinilabiliaceae bacterium]|nr:hypothetical protein [Marinilabiliaceae bacterium]